MKYKAEEIEESVSFKPFNFTISMESEEEFTFVHDVLLGGHDNKTTIGDNLRGQMMDKIYEMYQKNQNKKEEV